MADVLQTVARLHEGIAARLCCPACRSAMERSEVQYTCRNAACARVYPVARGIPVLLCEENSVFRLADFAEDSATFYETASRPRWKQFLVEHIPNWLRNVKAADNFRALAALLRQRPGTQYILVLGGSVFNRGMEPLLDPQFILVETDVALGGRTQLIVDAHDIPFLNQTFDAIVAQAVLEHVAAPWEVTEEIHRLLKPDGIVYVETPFLQAVHAGAYDFTRFTHLGHRRLFRRFDEIDSGAVCGPGTMFASAYMNFLTALAPTPGLRRAFALFAHFTIFWPKWFDGWLIDKPATLDCAFGYYFLGRRSGNVLSDRELVGLYRGAQGRMKRRIQ